MNSSSDRRGVRMMSGWGHDVRMALRAFRATPMVTAIAVASLALAIGANTAIFSIANSLLLNSLPVRDPGRLVHVTDSIRRDTGEIRVRAWSNPFWEQIQARPELFESATAWSFARFDLAPAGETQLVDGIWADGGFFETLGVQAAIGRTFTALDDRPGGGPDGAVAVLGYGCWQRRFGGLPSVIGQTLTLNGVPFTIIGVTPRGFLRPRSRPRVRRHRAARHRSPRSRPRLGPAIRLDELPEHRCAVEAGPVARCGRHRDLRARAGGDSPGDARPVGQDRRRSLSRLAVHRPPCGQRLLEPAPRLRPPAADHRRRGRAGAADRVCERRQPAAGARHRAPARAERAGRARRLAVAAGAAAARRERHPVGCRRCIGHVDRLLGQPVPRASAVDGRRGRARSIGRRSSPGVHNRRGGAHGAAFRHGTGVARRARQPDRGHQGAGPRRGWRRTRGPDDVAGGAASGAVDGAADRRRTLRPLVHIARRARPWSAAGSRADRDGRSATHERSSRASRGAVRTPA